MFNNSSLIHHVDEESQITDSFPVRNVSGETMGHVRLRVSLKCVPSNKPNQPTPNGSNTSMNQPKPFPLMHSRNCNLHSVSLLHDRKVQTYKQHLECSTQTEYEHDVLSHIPSFDSRVYLNDKPHEIKKMTTVSILGQPVSPYCILYYTNPNVNIWQKENLDVAPIQPSALCFTHTKEPMKSCSCETEGEQIYQRIHQPLSSTERTNQRAYSSSKLQNEMNPITTSLPTLRSLIEEMKILKESQSHYDEPFVGQNEQISSLIRAIQSELSALTVKNKHSSSKSMKSVQPTTFWSQSRTPFTHENKMTTKHLRKLASPKHRPPPPGKMVPKDRGWLRSTPVYRGPTQSSLVPKLTLTHFLRVQKNKPSIVHCLTSSAKECKVPLHRTAHSERKSLAGNKDVHVNETPLKKLELESIEKAQSNHSEQKSEVTSTYEDSSTSSISEDTSSDDDAHVTNSRCSHINDNDNHSNNNILTIDAISDNKKQSSLLKSQSVNDEKSMTKESKSSVAIYVTTKKSKLSSSSSSSDLQSEDFLMIQPKQSNFSPQMSTANSHILQKCKQQMQQLETTAKTKHIDDYIDNEQDDDDSSAPVGTLSGHFSDKLQVSMNVTHERSVDGDDDVDIGDDVDLTSYSGDYEDSQNTGSLSFRSKIPVLSSPVESKHENSNKQRLESISLDGTTRMTSFTKVTAPLDRRLVYGGTTGELLTDTNIPPSMISGTDDVGVDDEEEDPIVQGVTNLPPTTITESSQHNLDLFEEFDIEAMRSRSSQDYILGGTVTT
ncbi:unnamed protein product [Heterobilharzia americana]|nr:unnamed protein product [Heterobilharzia americana]